MWSKFCIFLCSEPKSKGPSGALLSPELNPESDDDDADSMEDYSQMDPTKFNEDGSFIGQYGGQKRGNEIDASNPAALSTFV